MKKVTLFAVACVAAMTFVSCKKEVKDSGVPTEDLNQIRAMGLSTDGVRKVDGGYLVEGDIMISHDRLGERSATPNLTIASEEQYRTFNLLSVSRHPVVKVALANTSAAHEAAFGAALDDAIARYNAENLTFTMQRVTTGQDITVVAFYEVSNTLGSAGFPNSLGDPYNQVKMNTYHYSTGTTTTNINYISTIMAHEIGHCIGFRHTDYANRAYSCGGRRSNEGQSTTGVGAVHIPGTPTGGDPNSFMLACIGGGVNRPFNANDKVALSYLW